MFDFEKKNPKKLCLHSDKSSLYINTVTVKHWHDANQNTDGCKILTNYLDLVTLTFLRNKHWA